MLLPTQSEKMVSRVENRGTFLESSYFRDFRTIKILTRYQVRYDLMAGSNIESEAVWTA